MLMLTSCYTGHITYLSGELQLLWVVFILYCIVLCKCLVVEWLGECLIHLHTAHVKWWPPLVWGAMPKATTSDTLFVLIRVLPCIPLIQDQLCSFMHHLLDLNHHYTRLLVNKVGRQYSHYVEHDVRTCHLFQLFSLLYKHARAAMVIHLSDHMLKFVCRTTWGAYKIELR